MGTSQWFVRRVGRWSLIVALYLCGPSCVPPSSGEASESFQAIEDELVVPDELAAAIHSTLSTLWVGLGGYMRATRGQADMSPAMLIVPDIQIEFRVDPLDVEPPLPPVQIATIVVPDIRIEWSSEDRARSMFTATVPEIHIEFSNPRAHEKRPSNVKIPELKVSVSADDAPPRIIGVLMNLVWWRRVPGSARATVPDLLLHLSSDGPTIITVPDIEIALQPVEVAPPPRPVRNAKATVADLKVELGRDFEPVTMAVPDIMIALASNIMGDTPMPDPATIIVPNFLIELSESCMTVDGDPVQCPIAATMPDIMIGPEPTERRDQSSP